MPFIERSGVKTPLDALRPYVKLGLVAVFGLSFAAACSRDKNQPRELPSGKFVQPEVPATPAQARSLSDELENELSVGLSTLFAESLASVERGGLGTRDRELLAEALAKSFAKGMTQKVGRQSSTNCVAAPEKSAAFLSCLFYEIVEDNFQNERDARRWLSSAAQTDKATGRALLSPAQLEVLSVPAPVLMVSMFAQADRVEAMLVRMNRSLDTATRALEILAVQQASMDLPYLGSSFIEGKRYVLTTSLQQGSVGSSRVFNLDSMIVEFKINNKRLIVSRPGEGLYAGSSQEDLIVASYPIVRTVEEPQSKEKYFQVDFSRPENKGFLVAPFGAGNEPALQMQADVVVPKISHAPKATLAGMNNGLYFNGKDSSLVIDKLVLISASAPLLGGNEDAGEEATGKDSLRPTVHLVQGFFPLPSGKDPFAETQALPLSVSQMELRSRGVNDRTEGKDVPYFATEPLFESRGGRAREPVAYVRKFNLEKDVTFVISRSVPAPVVPVFKSAVNSYAELFKGLTPEGKAAPRITALTQDEFEALNRDSGLALGGAISAADPRVNMIFWDDSFAIGSAWATAAANPKTGEIISGDVMMTGSMWAMEGCKSYFARTWQKDKEPNLPKRPAGTVPSPVSRFLWDAKCDAALANLGIFSKRNSNGGDVSPAALQAFDEANRKGDLVALARFASQTLGRAVRPAEMVSSLEPLNPSSAAQLTSADHLASEIRGQLGLKSSASVKDLVEKRARELEAAYKGSSPESFVKRLSTGKSFVNSRLDCVKQFIPNADINMAESGAPVITSPLVNSPEAGALALLRSVLVHELGHVFGLRHNFIASTTPAELAADAKPPVAVDVHSDSVMDYNDYGIDMGSGAMKDFASADGAAGLPTFGAYDIVALAAAYYLPSDGMKFKSQTAFCTDRNVTTLGNCQRFDYGKDFNEFTLHRANVILQRLRYANPMDAVLDPRSPMVYAQLVRSLGQELQKLTALWGIAQQSAAESNEFAARNIYLQLAELGYNGKGAQQEFLKSFGANYGVEPIALSGALQLKPEFFASPEYGAVISELVRKDVGISVMAVTRLLQTRAKGKGSDSAYTGVVNNLFQGGVTYAYLDELLDHYSHQVVLPKGKAVDFEFFDDGQRKDSSQAKLDGQPFVFSLPEALFNHRMQVLAVPNTSIDGPAPGSRKSVTLIIKGQKSIEDMVFAISALGVLAGENPEHPAVARLGSQAQALQLLLNREPCTPASNSSADGSGAALGCEALRPEARAPAAIILNAIMAAAQGALPTTTVASGETAF
jgi:hypothetical protein